jgi:mannose-6-phosphate isomerase
MVWGGRHLAEVLGKPLPSDEAYGESWEVSDHPSHSSVVASGPWAGRTLRDLMEHEASTLLGKPELTTDPGFRCATPGAAPLTTHHSPPAQRTTHHQRSEPFPWLIKFLDACDWLSVQVHPDEEAVRQLWPGEGSKTEAWFILAARPQSRVYAGLLPGVNEKQLRGALAEGVVAACLHSFHPRPGDCLFLPAGTVHAVGGGVLIAEVQQTSDATFRLFDWNRRDAQGRSRTLHIEEALACIDWEAGPVQPVSAEGYPQPPGRVARSDPVRQRLVTCRYFHLDYLRRSEAFPIGGAGCLQAMTVLHGRATLETPDGPQHLKAGETLLLPATMPVMSCQPEEPVGMLLCTLP